MDNNFLEKSNNSPRITLYIGVSIIAFILLSGLIVLIFKSRISPPVSRTQPINEISAQQERPSEGVQKNTVLVKEAKTVNSKEVQEVNQVVYYKHEPKVDSDGDGVSDEEEEKIGTNPKVRDTDLDGIWDGEEIYGWKTDPLKRDTDGDGLSDYWEVKKYSTDPFNPDTDGDGYLDGQEVHNWFNPKGPGKLQELKK